MFAHFPAQSVADRTNKGGFNFMVPTKSAWSNMSACCAVLCCSSALALLAGWKWCHMLWAWAGCSSHSDTPPLTYVACMHSHPALTLCLPTRLVQHRRRLPVRLRHSRLHLAASGLTGHLRLQVQHPRRLPQLASDSCCALGGDAWGRHAARTTAWAAVTALLPTTCLPMAAWRSHPAMQERRLSGVHN